MAKKEFYQYVLTHENGNTDDTGIKENLGLFNQFCSVGFVTQGIDGIGNRRWKITDFGKVQISSYLELVEMKEQLYAFLMPR